MATKDSKAKDVEEKPHETTVEFLASLAAVLVTGTDSPELRRNQLLNGTGRPAVLLLDWSSNEPVLEGNLITGGERQLSGRVWVYAMDPASRSGGV